MNMKIKNNYSHEYDINMNISIHSNMNVNINIEKMLIDFVVQLSQALTHNCGLRGAVGEPPTASPP